MKGRTVCSANDIYEHLNHMKCILRRESKLTRLLQDSLGGNSRTLLIAAISPLRCTELFVSNIPMDVNAQKLRFKYFARIFEQIFIVLVGQVQRKLFPP